MWHSHTLEHCAAMKRNGVLTHTMTCVNLENIVWSERTGPGRHIVYDASIGNIPSRQRHRARKLFDPGQGARGGEVGRRGGGDSGITP